MRVSVRFIDDFGGPDTKVERDLYNDEGKVIDDVTYPEAVHQTIILVRSAIHAEYGYDLPDVWEPIIDAIP